MRKLTARCARLVGFFIIAAAFTAAAYAQNLTDNQESGPVNEPASVQTVDDALNKKNEFALVGGFAPEGLKPFGGSRNSNYGEFSFRYSRRLATTENLALKYQVDFIPLAILQYDRELLVPGATVAAPPIVLQPDETAYAIGLMPVNFQLNFRRRTKIQPFANIGGGILYFNKDVPDDRTVLRPDRVGRRFNFALTGGGGVEFLTDDARSYTVGFKFHHISNNSTGNINPGFDQSLFYFGYTFKKW